MVSPRDTADDVMQDALLRAWRKRRSYDPAKGSPEAWLRAIVIHEARRTARRQARRAHDLTEDHSLGIERTHDIDTTLVLRAAVARLPARQHQVVLMFYYLDLPISEIAKSAGITEGAVKATLAKARRTIKRNIEGN